MYTVDASVWVNGFDRREPGHESSREVLRVLREQAHPVFLPNLAVVEVAGAISRTRQDTEKARSFARSLGDLPNVTVVALTEGLSRRALTLAAEHGLRGADAIYAAVADQFKCTLISLDNEHLTRLSDVITTRTPIQALEDLKASEPFP